MTVLLIKILGPVALLCVSVRKRWSKLRDKNTRWRALGAVALSAVVYAAAAVGLAVDHLSQGEALATSKASLAVQEKAVQDADRAQQAAEERAAEARKDAEDARAQLSRIEGQNREIMEIVRVRYPDATDEEALELIADEFRRLEGRATEFEDELDGLRKYGGVAELDPNGTRGLAGPGSGLRENSPLISAMEEIWEERDGQLYPRCDTSAIDKLLAVTIEHPEFPFAHYALSVCAFHVGDDSWRRHAEDAVEIFRHTTQIERHKPQHDQAFQVLQDRLAGAPPGR